MIPEEIRISWYSLCSTTQPRLPKAFARVAGTFTDPALPTAQLPSKALVEFFGQRQDSSPPLSALALVAMAGLMQAKPAKVLNVIQAVDEFVRLIGRLVPGEVQPDIHYRSGYLDQNRPETMFPAHCQSLVNAYETATTWVDVWGKRHPESGVLQHRLPGFQDRAPWIAQNLPPELKHEIEFFNTLQVSDDDGFTSDCLRYLCDNVIASGVPWACHLVIMFALSTPERRKQRRFAEDISSIHRLLLDRWYQAKFQKDMSAILVFSPPDESEYAVRVIRRHTRFMRHTVEERDRADLLPYVFDIPQLDRQKAEGWHTLKGSLDENLYGWCQRHLPETDPAFPAFAPLLPFLQKNTDHPFHSHLVLMAVGLASAPDIRAPTTRKKYLSNVAFRLNLLLEALGIDVPQFVPDLHLPRYMQLAEDEDLEEESADQLTPARAGIFNRDYETCTRAVEELFVRTQDTETVREWQLSPLTPEVYDDLRKKWTSEADPAAQARREQDMDLVIEHWGDLHCLAEARAVAVRHLMQAYHEAQQQTGPYPRELMVTLPLCSHRWHFLLWDTESYVRQHPDVFGADASFLATKTVPGTSFLEWTQVTNLEQREAVRPWFADLLAYQNVRPQERQTFLTRIGYSETAFQKTYTYPALNSTALKVMFTVAADNALQRGETPPCLFEPNELYSDVLMGLMQLRIIRVNGGRQHELLQVRLESQYLRLTEQGCIVRIQPKGRKDLPNPADRWEERFLSDRAVFVMHDLLELQVRIEGKIVPTEIRDVALKGTSHDRGLYLFNNGRYMLSAQEINRRLRFLTFGWDLVVTQKRLGNAPGLTSSGVASVRR